MIDYRDHINVDADISLTGQIKSSLTGLAPFLVASSLLVSNLNADLLDGYHASEFYTRTEADGKFAQFAATGISGRIPYYNSSGQLANSILNYSISTGVGSLSIGQQSGNDYAHTIQIDNPTEHARLRFTVSMWATPSTTLFPHPVIGVLNAAGSLTNARLALFSRAVDTGSGGVEFYTGAARARTAWISYDGVINALGGNSTNWNTAYSWGNHASANYVPQSRTISINGTSFDLSANRSWTIPTGGNLQATLDAGNTASNQSISVERATGSVAYIGRFGSGGGWISLGNNTGAAGNFLPTLRGESIGNNSYGISIIGQGHDTYATAAIEFSGRNAAGTGLVTSGKLFSLRNYTTERFSIDTAGMVTTAGGYKVGSQTGFLKADGTVDNSVYALNSTLSGYVPTSRTISINGTAFDLTANRSWTVTADMSNVYTKTESDSRYVQGGTGISGRIPYYNSSGQLANSLISYNVASSIVTARIGQQTGNNYAHNLIIDNPTDYTRFQIAASMWGMPNTTDFPHPIIGTLLGGSAANARLAIVGRAVDSGFGSIEFYTGAARARTAWISYDGVINALGGNSTNWNTAYSWGNHASAGYVSNAIGINTTNSLTGGGNLTTSRTLQLVGDSSSPGNSRYYGTNASGTKGWHALPSGGSGTVTQVGLLVPTGFTVTSSPVTTSGNLQFAFASGYSLPTTASQNTWNAKIGGSGSTNRIPMFTAGSTLGDSPIYHNGGNIGIGTSPSHKFQVAGNSYLGGDVFATGTISTSSNCAASTGFSTVSGGYYAGTNSLHSSAIGQFDSTTKGFLIPRMTMTQFNSISGKQPGLIAMIVNPVDSNDILGMMFYTGSTTKYFQAI